jgi:hypothetical protein
MKKLHQFSNLFQNIEPEGVLLNSFYDVSLIQIFKPDKGITKLVSLMETDAQNLNKI